MRAADMQSRITFAPVWVDPVMTILRQVAEDYGVTVNDLRGDSRAPRFSHPRQIAYVRLRDETNMSLPVIGRVMGGKHHTTVHKGIAAARARIREGQTT